MLPFTNEITLHTALNLEATLFCGQAFRWKKTAEHRYQAMVYGEMVQLNLHGNSLGISASSQTINNQSLSDFISTYLGLNDDLSKVFSHSFTKFYPELYHQAEPYFGLRLLRQEIFETLISFMCAQGIGVALIRRQVQLISDMFGEKSCFSTSERRFPTPESLAKAPLSKLTRCTNNNPIRAKNIRDISKSIYDGKLNLNDLRYPKATLDEARDTLLEYNGIGDKIADCVCLFGLGHLNAFPIDTHVRQYLETWFHLSTTTKSLTTKEYKRLSMQACEILGTNYSGLAGQLLFHHWRKDIKHLTAF